MVVVEGVIAHGDLHILIVLITLVHTISDPVVEMSAGKLIIFVQFFAATKCLACLVSKEPPPTCEAPSPVILNSAIISYRTLLTLVSLQY